MLPLSLGSRVVLSVARMAHVGSAATAALLAATLAADPAGGAPFRPTCITTPGSGSRPARCEISSPDGGAPSYFPCKGHKTHGAGAVPGTTGAWSLDSNYTYYIDRGLVEAIATMAQGTSVIEFGSGMGCYVAALKDSHRLAWAEGFDGAPAIGELTRGLVRNADLTNPNLRLGCADVVLCLEVAEHIPPAFEGAFLRNLDAHNARTIILSWSSHVGGLGHVNPRNNAYVQERMQGLGYTFNATATAVLRRAARINWLRASVARFDRAVPLATAAARAAQPRGGGARSAGSGGGVRGSAAHPGRLTSAQTKESPATCK